MQKEFIDQLSRKVAIPYPPRRIISLVPSQTELLFDLGLEEEVVGITKFCIHPAAWFQYKTKVGGTKNFWFDKIDALRPDLIIGNKEENYSEGIRQLEEKYPIWISDISDITQALEMIRLVGALMDRVMLSEEIIVKINQGFEHLPIYKSKRVVYLIWQAPWMAAGKGTFIDAMLAKIGLVNAIQETRYPELTVEQIRSLNPEVVMLSSEPFPFKQNHIDAMRKILPHAEVLLVDGEPFSWYGSRMIHAPAYFSTLPLQQS